jgi:hypothetical protein
MSQPPEPHHPDSNDPDDQKTWDAIVADLSGQVDLGPQFTPDPTPQELAPGPDYIDAYFDEGYEPPEPPPIQVPADAITRFAWAGVLGGPLLMLFGYVLGLGSAIAITGLVATVGGFAFLISKRDKHEPPGEDFGDGAVV